MPRKRPPVGLLITDLDNTLYDWVNIWFSTFSVMLEAVAQQSGVPRRTLENEARAVHQLYGTSEYTFLLGELPSLRELHPDGDMARIYDSAIHAFRSVRKQTTVLYPTVAETLQYLRRMGTPIAAYTDSLAFHSFRRVKTLGLDGLINALYSPPDHGLPDGTSLSEARSGDESEYQFEQTEHRFLTRGESKPQPEILKQICEDFGVTAQETAYVGDSLMKDVAMAQSIGALDIYAAYGVAHNQPGYDMLKRVSHWSDAEIARERQLAASREVTPTYTLEHEFAELLGLLSFGDAT